MRNIIGRLLKLESQTPKTRLLPIATYNYQTRQIDMVDHTVYDTRGIISVSYKQLYDTAWQRCEQLYRDDVPDRDIQDFEED